MVKLILYDNTQHSFVNPFFIKNNAPWAWRNSSSTRKRRLKPVQAPLAQTLLGVIFLIASGLAFPLLADALG
jgi:hypothetical protein